MKLSELYNFQNHLVSTLDEITELSEREERLPERHDVTIIANGQQITIKANCQLYDDLIHHILGTEIKYKELGY